MALKIESVNYFRIKYFCKQINNYEIESNDFENGCEFRSIQHFIDDCDLQNISYSKSFVKNLSYLSSYTIMTTKKKSKIKSNSNKLKKLKPNQFHQLHHKPIIKIQFHHKPLRLSHKHQNQLKTTKLQTMRAQREHLFYFLQQAQSQQRGQNSKLGDGAFRHSYETCQILLVVILYFGYFDYHMMQSYNFVLLENPSYFVRH